MDQLVTLLEQRVGLSHEQAEQAVSVFAEFLKNNMSGDQLQSLAQQVPGLSQFADKLPGGLGGRLGDVLGGFGKSQG